MIYLHYPYTAKLSKNTTFITLWHKTNTKAMITLLYRIYQLFIVLPLAFLLTLFVCITIITGCLLGGGKYFGYKPGVWWGKGIIRMLLLPVKVEGREHLKENQSYVFVANHQGAFDIFLIYGFLKRDIRWMMKYELGNIPIFGRACRESKQILVDNRSVSKIKRCYQEAREILRGGTSLAVFPEGARTWDGKMIGFKKGAFMLADELQLPVVPITINGSFTVKPRFKDMSFCYWSPLKLTIHAPIEPQGQGSDNINQLMTRSFAAIEKDLIINN